MNGQFMPPYRVLFPRKLFDGFRYLETSLQNPLARHQQIINREASLEVNPIPE
jgi:hypothetical protein